MLKLGKPTVLYHWQYKKEQKLKCSQLMQTCSEPQMETRTFKLNPTFSFFLDPFLRTIATAGDFKAICNLIKNIAF